MFLEVLGIEFSVLHQATSIAFFFFFESVLLSHPNLVQTHDPPASPFCHPFERAIQSPAGILINPCSLTQQLLLNVPNMMQMQLNDNFTIKKQIVIKVVTGPQNICT